LKQKQVDKSTKKAGSGQERGGGKRAPSSMISANALIFQKTKRMDMVNTNPGL